VKDDLRPLFGLGNLRCNRRADGDVFRVSAIDAAHHAGAFCQIDKRHIVRLLRGPGVDCADGIDSATTARLNPFERLPFGASKARRKIGSPVAGIALQQEATLSKGRAPMCFGRGDFGVAHAAGISRGTQCVN